MANSDYRRLSTPAELVEIASREREPIAAIRFREHEKRLRKFTTSAAALAAEGRRRS